MRARREARPSYRMTVRAALRIVGSIIVLVALYYLLPLEHSPAWGAVTILVIGLAIFIGLVLFQARSIIRSSFPGLRVIEALANGRVRRHHGQDRGSAARGHGADDR
jgi:voltage-gated potassium channel